MVHGARIRTYQFRDQPEKVAFTERWLSMETALNSAAVIKAMIDRAQHRGCTAMRLADSEDFKRQAWIATETRGIKAVGHEPTQNDRPPALNTALITVVLADCLALALLVVGAVFHFKRGG